MSNPGGTDMERMIWAAAFVAEHARELMFRQDNPRDHLPIQGISGFSCAEIADLALARYREAMYCDDAVYLIPVKESWEQ